jgi:hypothetical protein
MSRPKASIIIPNWNGKIFLIDCLESLFKIDYSNYQIIIVDNGSIDGSAEFVKKEFPKVFLIENKKNLGFAAACNQGIKRAIVDGADYILLLNNDTVVSPDFLEKMIAAGESDKKIGIIGAKIYYFDQLRKIWFAGGDFVWWRVSGKHRFWQKQEKQELTGAMPSDFITGCAMLIKKQVFEDIGYFYEPFFLSVEDLDFCWRAKKNKWKIVVDLNACLWHKVSSSRDGEFSFSNGYYGTRNRLIFAFRRSKNYFGGFIFLFIIIPIRLFQWTISRKNQMVKGMVLAVIDFLKGKSGHYVKPKIDYD